MHLKALLTKLPYSWDTFPLSFRFENSIALSNEVSGVPLWAMYTETTLIPQFSFLQNKGIALPWMAYAQLRFHAMPILYLARGGNLEAFEFGHLPHLEKFRDFNEDCWCARFCERKRADPQSVWSLLFTVSCFSKLQLQRKYSGFRLRASNYRVRAAVLNQGGSAPRGTFGNVWRPFWLSHQHPGREVRDAAKGPSMHGAATHCKELPSPKGQVCQDSPEHGESTSCWYCP